MVYEWCIPSETALRWMSLDFTNDKVDSGKSVAPSSNKPLTETVAILRH